MPVTLTKAELKKIQVAERKNMRAKHQNQKFTDTSRNKYNRMKDRAAEAGATLAFTLAEFRLWMRQALHKPCHYCTCHLTLTLFTPEHMTSVAQGGVWTFDNLVRACKPCNWQKGILSAESFAKFLAFCREQLTLAEAADMKQRLSIGGKWKPGR